MLKISKKQFLVFLLFSLIGSTLNLGILFAINLAIGGNSDLGLKHALFFFTILTYSWFFNLVFQRMVIRTSNEFIYDNEMHLCHKVLKSSLIDFEKKGKEGLYGVMEDLRSLVFIPYVITNGLNSLITVIVGITYLFIISAKAAFIFIVAALLLVLIYLLINRSVILWSQQSRELNDDYFKIIRDLIDGFKELKLSSIKQINLTEKFLEKNRKSAKKMEIKVSNFFLITNMMGNYSFLAVVGIIAFVLPAFQFLEQSKVGTFIVILLFISGALNALFSLQGFYARIYVANKRIKSFISDLEDHENEKLNTVAIEDTFGNIRFDGVSFSYPDGEFSLDSINLEIAKGETIFVIGGNGSGKSTFINLLTNLYSPSQGTIFLDENAVGNANQEYRNKLAVIFTNNYLFSENYSNYSLDNNTVLDSLIHDMKLDEVIDKSEDLNKKKFSKGQSKRISMILALLENKPILILDEWAADQDPYFRRYFYEVILPKLKEEGKTIVAVTHDDAYFKHADRIVKFDYGKIVKDIKVDQNSLDKAVIWN